MDHFCIHCVFALHNCCALQKHSGAPSDTRNPNFLHLYFVYSSVSWLAPFLGGRSSKLFFKHTDKTFH